MRAVWTTDPHLNFLSVEDRQAFFSSITSQHPSVVFLTGDMAEAPSLHFHLQEMAEAIQAPMYFVLGNHDFFYGSIGQVDEALTRWCQSHPTLTYLPQAGVVEFTKTTALVGQNGWGDGRLGNYQQSPVILSDHVLIKDLKGLSRGELRLKLESLGQAEAAALREVAYKALESYQHIILLTHVPPFKEACWYQGKPGNNDWLPFFTCKAIGDVLLDMMCW